MTNSKISGLTGATTPLGGTELVPIVQGGVTDNVSVANLTLGRAVNTAGGTFTDNQTQGTAAKGINFTANTPAAGMTSQLLNWYEEGTWTPNQGAGLTVVGAFSSSGRYTRMGRVVFVQGTLNAVTSITTTVATPITSNLPYVAGTAACAGSFFGNSLAVSGVIAIGVSDVYATSAVACGPALAFSATYTI